MLEIELNNYLKIKNLNDEWKSNLSDLVSVENLSKKRAQKELIWGSSKLPDKFTLAKEDGNDLILPRGFWPQLKHNLEKEGWEFNVNDQMVGSMPPGSGENNKFSFIDNQEIAYLKIIDKHSGRIIAAPGRGKTVIGLAAMVYLGTKSLILVEKTHIAAQWKDRGREHFNLDIGMIGDKDWEEKEISIATIQTLWSRKEELDKNGWWANWEFVLLDEQHHVPAESFIKIVQRFPARYRVGMGATIGKSHADKKVSELVFGPILYNDSNMALNPTVEVQTTDFVFDFHPTHTIEVNGKKRIKRNNYQKMIQAIIRDSSRNHIIAENIIERANRSQLIVSRRLEHLETIMGMVKNFQPRCFFLTGKQTTEERMEVYKLVENSPNSCVFSTVADEALDIPKLDTIHLIFPGKNEETVYQQIGRICRTHPDKNNPVIIDYVDSNVGVLYSQFRNRLRKVYQKRKIQVK